VKARRSNLFAVLLMLASSAFGAGKTNSPSVAALAETH